MLKDKFSEFYETYIAYTIYEFESIAKALLRAGQEPTETLLFTLGTAPYEEFTKAGQSWMIFEFFGWFVQVSKSNLSPLLPY